MSACKYVSQDLFDERTGNMQKSLDKQDKRFDTIEDKLDKLNTWKLKVVFGASGVAAVIAVIWQLLVNREAIAGAIEIWAK